MNRLVILFSGYEERAKVNCQQAGGLYGVKGNRVSLVCSKETEEFRKTYKKCSLAQVRTWKTNECLGCACINHVH